MPVTVSARLRVACNLAAGPLAAVIAGSLVYSTPASAAAPANSVVKIVNGPYSVAVDNGWTAFQHQLSATAPSLRRFVQDVSGSFTASGAIKLKTSGAGAAGNGAIFNLNAIVFAPCPAASAPKRCAASDFGTAGVGLAFGQTTFGSASATAGWVSDYTATANFTDVDFNTPGSVAGVAVDSVNGAYAVGWSLAATPPFKTHGLIMTLNSAAQTYKVASRTDLGTLPGGSTSQALAISPNALHVVGLSDAGDGIVHAVYAPSNGTSWTDITTGFSPLVIKSRALAVSNTGIVAGTATVKRFVGTLFKSVDIGFTYDTNTMSLTFFEVPGADIVPLKVLDDGRVVGNLEYVKTTAGATGLAETHPFLYDGTVHDFGTMVLPGPSAAPAYSCRVNRANNLGELVGSCIPNAATPYGVLGKAFYIDVTAASPAFIDLNAALHANANATNPSAKPYTFGTAASIDDQHEIVVIGRNKSSAQSAFIASKPAYNP